MLKTLNWLTNLQMMRFAGKIWKSLPFDKCKDSLVQEICSLVQKTLYSEFGVESTKIAPLTDGGEGFVEIAKAKGGTFHSVQAKDSLKLKVKIGIVSVNN